MKTAGAVLFFFTFTFSTYSQNYTIVGKGNAGKEMCSGYVCQNDYFKTISIVLSDMLSMSFIINKKEQIDERTIKYTCTKKIDTLDDSEYEIYTNFLGNSGIKQKKYTIVKQKCNISEKVYFFQFPPLYDGQGTTVYKTTKK